jgi:2-oxo-4-hydroxy-4-carboxy-5-ureidoimidazoline decarboxylase
MIIDTASKGEAMEMLRACCGSTRWVEQMMARRPFGTREAVLQAADEIWNGLSEKDWLDAFTHHPRIGGSKAAVAQDRRGSFWSEKEQAGMARADGTVKSELALANENYERRFGFIYIVCATGKTAEEMLEIARARLANDRATEIRVAAEEQRKIMQLRLAKLLDEAKA